MSPELFPRKGLHEEFQTFQYQVRSVDEGSTPASAEMF